ncbi:hypothetical protein [Halomonas nitroreducens]|uniref:Catalase n=1 Tax=Halomonas nitroreducens TaxID=447425 RepID=A0A3S0QZY3_9GAMM|nr:hypothetical protein [Halomonas nitroreducens]RTR00462.1 hypothetical protein EKG36_15755 [Halomonas nitroreducens]
MKASRPDRDRRVLHAGLALMLAGLAGCGDADPPLVIAEERASPAEPRLEAEMTESILAHYRRQRTAHPERPIPRFNQPKTLACPAAMLRVPELPEQLARGLFARPGEYPATLRFANATRQDDREPDLRGLSIRVEDVPGASGVDGTPGRQDFLLNSHPVLFAGTPEDFHAFVEAVTGERMWWYFLTHPRSLWIAWRARGQPNSLLNMTFWSTTPYRYGKGEAVKYAVRPCDDDTSPAEAPAGDGDPDFLRHAMAERLSEGSACLALQVQFQQDPERMPIEDASVAWDETRSPFHTVARLTLPAQRVEDPAALSRCEGMAFNPWNGHPDHRPLGGINRVRRGIYEAVGALRTEHHASLVSPGEAGRHPTGGSP